MLYLWFLTVLLPFGSACIAMKPTAYTGCPDLAAYPLDDCKTVLDDTTAVCNMAKVDFERAYCDEGYTLVYIIDASTMDFKFASSFKCDGHYWIVNPGEKRLKDLTGGKTTLPVICYKIG